MGMDDIGPGPAHMGAQRQSQANQGPSHAPQTHHIHAQNLEFFAKILLGPPYGNLQLKAVPVHRSSEVAEGAWGAAQAEIRDQAHDIQHGLGFNRSTSTSGMPATYHRPPTSRGPADPTASQIATQTVTAIHS